MKEISEAVLIYRDIFGQQNVLTISPTELDLSSYAK